MAFINEKDRAVSQPVSQALLLPENKAAHFQIDKTPTIATMVKRLCRRTSTNA